MRYPLIFLTLFTFPVDILILRPEFSSIAAQPSVQRILNSRWTLLAKGADGRRTACGAVRGGLQPPLADAGNPASGPRARFFVPVALAASGEERRRNDDCAATVGSPSDHITVIRDRLARKRILPGRLLKYATHSSESIRLNAGLGALFERGLICDMACSRV